MSRKVKPRGKQSEIERYLNATLPDPEIVQVRTLTAEAILRVLGPIADEHGINEAIRVLMVTLAWAERNCGADPRACAAGMNQSRAYVRKVLSQIGADASIRETMVELHMNG